MAGPGAAWLGTAGEVINNKQRRETMATKKTAASNGNTTTTEAPTTAGAEIHIPRIKRETLIVPILGITPLIVHRFSEKAKKQMLDAMQGRKSPKQAKNPEAEYESAFYRMNDGRPGMIAGAFKDATVGGARFYHAVKMTEIKSFLWFLGELGSDGRMMVPIEGEPNMREDVVRVSRGGTDLRYRPQFLQWRTSLTVTYPVSNLGRESVLSLIDAGGMGVGVGEWRPEKGGEFGTYCVDPDREVEVIQ
jgi:hypothetical protein